MDIATLKKQLKEILKLDQLPFSDEELLELFKGVKPPLTPEKVKRTLERYDQAIPKMKEGEAEAMEEAEYGAPDIHTEAIDNSDLDNLMNQIGNELED